MKKQLSPFNESDINCKGTDAEEYQASYAASDRSEVSRVAKHVAPYARRKSELLRVKRQE
jgi:hypothetical protein